jgi:hypothetical protein
MTPPRAARAHALSPLQRECRSVHCIAMHADTSLAACLLPTHQHTTSGPSNTLCHPGASNPTTLVQANRRPCCKQTNCLAASKPATMLQANWQPCCKQTNCLAASKPQPSPYCCCCCQPRPVPPQPPSLLLLLLPAATSAATATVTAATAAAATAAAAHSSFDSLYDAAGRAPFWGVRRW